MKNCTKTQLVIYNSSSMKKMHQTYVICLRPHIFYVNLRKLCIVNISSVTEFQRWWVLKSKLFCQESTWHQGKIFKKILRVMTVHQKVTKSYFQSQFWMSKINHFFSKKIFISEYQFRRPFFGENIFF